jgi:hypothetical protein
VSERLAEPQQDPKGRRLQTPLELADIRHVDTCTIGELFLRNPCRLANSLQLLAENRLRGIAAHDAVIVATCETTAPETIVFVNIPRLTRDAVR